MAGLGGDPDGLRKPQLIERLAELISDPDTVARAVAGLSQPARRHLDLLMREYLFFGGGGRGSAEQQLIAAGLLVAAPSYPELPREVAVELRLAESGGLAGHPAAADVDR